MTRRLVILTVAAGASLGMMIPTVTPAEAPMREPGVFVVEEDDPRWNCLTMGNRICGQSWELVELEGHDYCLADRQGIACADGHVELY